MGLEPPNGDLITYTVYYVGFFDSEWQSETGKSDIIVPLLRPRVFRADIGQTCGMFSFGIPDLGLW